MWACGPRPAFPPGRLLGWLPSRPRVAHRGTPPDIQAAFSRGVSAWLTRAILKAGASAVVPNDPGWRLQRWHYQMIRLPQAWDVTRGRADVVVAVFVARGGAGGDRPPALKRISASKCEMNSV